MMSLLSFSSFLSSSFACSSSSITRSTRLGSGHVGSAPPRTRVKGSTESALENNGRGGGEMVGEEGCRVRK